MKREVILKNINVHNLKGINLNFNTNEFIVFTGVSGSGKSSLAFDTLFVEGQRRYVESLSAFARQYIGHLSKPNFESISGLSPTIAIDQKTIHKNPRSTIGTITEIYDYLRLLYARIGLAHCPLSGELVAPQSKERIIHILQALPKNTKLIFLAPIAKNKKGEFKEEFQFFLSKGYTRARVNGRLVDLSETIHLDKHHSHDIEIVIDRLIVSPDSHSRIAAGVIAGLELGNGILLTYDIEKKQEHLYSTHAYSSKSGYYYSSLEPHNFSFNHPEGMCLRCKGLGFTQDFDFEKIIDQKKSIAEDCCLIASSYKTIRFKNIYDNLAAIYQFSVTTPWEDLSHQAKQIFLYGTEKKWTQMHFTHPNHVKSWSEYVCWKGVIPAMHERLHTAKSTSYQKTISRLMDKQICCECKGARIQPYPAATEIGGERIQAICSKQIRENLSFFSNLHLNPYEYAIAEEIIKTIIRRLQFLKDVGLDYLSLSRPVSTLSGGEAQRVRLASQVGGGLVGVTYILDEPSIGLHPRDTQKLIAILKRLRDAGNTVIVVEHDEETIRAADRLIDFGPGPGILGGNILFNGSLKEILENSHSLTGKYLSGKAKIDIPVMRKYPCKKAIQIIEATHNNLKKITVTFPLELMIAITGVSGSGKSSLISDTLFPALANRLHDTKYSAGNIKTITGYNNIDRVIAIDQTPIGRTPRSNPATYINIFDEIRKLFSQLPDSIARGYAPGRFSFNVSEGSCLECQGIGMVCINMDFLEDQWVTCESCQSKRFDHDTLSIQYKGNSIHDILEMTVGEAQKLFADIPVLKSKLDLVARVGLDYIKLGQSSTTLSGGEAQRIKLAKELARPKKGKTFYILDEPTTGLHFHDIKALLNVFQELIASGHTILVIEHNMDVVKTADWMIELGPEGGDQGGKVIAEGSPEQCAQIDTPTGRVLKNILSQKKYSVKKQDLTPCRATNQIIIKGAKQNNLKGIDVEIPQNKLTICTGPSGAGKSSLVFDTVYAEGQRRYIESLSPYARQFIKQMDKPKVSQIEGLSPAIAIEQKATPGTSRSTVGTKTEIYDYLRLLFAHLGVPYCPDTGEIIKAITKNDVVKEILKYPEGEKITLLAPINIDKNEDFENLLNYYSKKGYVRIYLEKKIYELDSPIPFDKRRKQNIALVIDRITIHPQAEHRLLHAIENAVDLSKDKILVIRGEKEILFNLSFAVQSTGKSYPEITPQTFSFNGLKGMCPDCKGLGYQYGVNLTRHPKIMSLSTGDLLRVFWGPFPLSRLQRFLQKESIDLDLPLHDLNQRQLQLILNGTPEKSWIATEQNFSFRWRGIQPTLTKLAKNGHHHIRSSLISLLDEIECLSCLGTRLNPLARNVRILEQSISSICNLPITQIRDFIKKLPFNQNMQEVVKQLETRLSFLIEIGLDYLHLNRRLSTLSNGEVQRIHLARQLGSSLTGVLYILDEPTIGLHPHDNHLLNQMLLKLKTLGNTLLIVEHDPQVISTADYILDFGPGSGSDGGQITAKGTYEEILNNPSSLTGSYLSGKNCIPQRKKNRKVMDSLFIENATKHNLKNLSFKIPIGLMTGLTGPSGSGKSTLMYDILKPFAETLIAKNEVFNKLVIITQNPIGYTIRSDIGTYLDLFPLLRTFYASLSTALVQGLTPSHFSYNHRKGMCTACSGIGYKKLEMLFLPPVKVICRECQGLRLNPLSLKVKYQGKSFGELLDMTVKEARVQFEILPKICHILDILISVGLDYIQLGQRITSLSGGEAQRIKLSRELGKNKKGNTLYLFDEPTAGLHFDDIRKLLPIFHHLVDEGNTIVIIEHNMEIIKNCDYLIDLGPSGGINGGQIVAIGTPKMIAKNPYSLTGKYL
ncbi:MAG: excinuclease ABC subunit UvrA [Chlamydiales bacterium]